MILGTAGHIDHGKTTLVRALTGVDTDRLPEEKKRGITIDLGFAPLVLDGLPVIGIVDVPGHEAFVRTMLAGASGIDLALMVVAADEGVMPQTREHLEILSLLGITHGVIALTKADLVDDEWRELVTDDVRALVADTAMAGAAIVPVSAKSGEGIAELKAAIGAAVQCVAVADSADDYFRMPVDRAFSVRGTGTVVTGTVWSGRVDRDATLVVQPGGKAVRVRAIQAHGAAVKSAGKAMRTALALVGCELADVGRGSTLVSTREWTPTQELEVVLDSLSPEFAPTSKMTVRVHLGTAETGGRFVRLRPAGRGVIRCRLLLDDPLIARGQDRFVLRMPSPSRTVGGGTVLDSHPVSHGRRRLHPITAPAVDGAFDGDRHRPEETNPTAPRALLALVLGEAGAEGVPTALLPVRTGIPAGSLSAGLKDADAFVAGSVAWSRTVAERVERFVLQFVSREIVNHPLEAGVSLQTLRASAKCPVVVMDYALERLKSSGKIEVDGALVRPKGWAAELTEHERLVSEAILAAVEGAVLEPPSVSELAGTFGRDAETFLRMHERGGMVERVEKDRYFSTDALKRMFVLLGSSLEPGRIYSPAELRGVLGVTRKYLIPLLEYCDRKGVTERRLDGRIVRPFQA